MADVRVSDRLTESNSVIIPNVSGLKASWEISAVGAMTFSVQLRDLPAAYQGRPRDLLSRWIRYTHPTAGAWGGYISAVGGQDGRIDVTCQSWAGLLRGVWTTGAGIGTAISSAIQNIIQDAAVPQPHGILRGDTTIQGSNFLIDDTMYQKDQDLLDGFLPSIMEAYMQKSGHHVTHRLLQPGWEVNAVDRKFNWHHAFGVDNSATVVLADRVHLASSSWSDDTEDVFNRVALHALHNYQYLSEPIPFTDFRQERVKVKGKWKWKWVPFTNYRQDTLTGVSADPVYGVDLPSQARHGTKSVSVAIPGFTFPNLAAKQVEATRMAAYMATNEQLCTLEVVDNAPPNLTGVWATFREGHVVRVDLSNSGTSGKMLIRSRALDLDSGRMTVAGEAVLD